MCKPALLISLILVSRISALAVRVEIHTDNQMDIRGEVVRIDSGFIYLTTEGYQTIGIQLENIAKLKPENPMNLTENTREILYMKEILHLWDISTQMQFVSYAETLAERNEWNACFRSAKCVAEHAREPSVCRTAAELKALALFKMGLYAQCEEAIEHLGTLADALHASARTCWIMAQLAVRKGDKEQALAWALIPKLRIPTDNSQIAIQLYTESQKWLNSK